jgi:tetratricopeptide (TPR) repeat protein
VSRNTGWLFIFYNGGVKTLTTKILLIGLALFWSWCFISDYHFFLMQQQADRLLASRQPEAAEAILWEVEQAEPWRKSAWNELAQQYFIRNNADSAIRILEALEQKGEMSSGGFSILARAYQKTGKDENVESALLKAVNLADTPDSHIETLQTVIQYYRSQTRFQEALAFQKQLTGLKTQSTESKINEVLLQTILNPSIGLSEWRSLTSKPSWLQQWGKALSTALSETDESMRWVTIGRAYAVGGEWDLAEFSLSKAVYLSPDFAEAWGLMAEARQQQGKDGKDQIEKALELAPQSPAVRLLGALYYRRQHDYGKSVFLLNKNLEDQPDEILWFHEMGRTLADSGQLEAAASAYSQAIQLAPADSTCYEALAHFSVQYEYRLEDVGLPAARQAVALKPDSAEANDNLGQVFFALGQNDQAVAAFTTALDKDPQYAPTWLHVGQIALAQNDPSRAKEALLKSVALGGNSEEGRLAVRLLKQYFQMTSGQPDE